MELIHYPAGNTIDLTKFKFFGFERTVSMNNTIEQNIGTMIDPFLKTTTYTVGIASLNLVIAVLMGTGIALVYRRYFQGTLFQKSYAVDLMLATAITCLVIMLISGNIILSLGMVGALSIVRFRTAVKDPSDTIYMFWAIAVGIGSGVGMHKITVACSIIIVCALELASKISSRPQPTMIVLSSATAQNSDRILDALRSVDRKITVRSEHIGESGFEMVLDTHSRLSSEVISSACDGLGVTEIRLFKYGVNG